MLREQLEELGCGIGCGVGIEVVALAVLLRSMRREEGRGGRKLDGKRGKGGALSFPFRHCGFLSARKQKVG